MPVLDLGELKNRKMITLKSDNDESDVASLSE